MNFGRALRAREALCHTVEDIATGTGLSLASARVLVSRQTQTGRLTRLRRNLYVLADDWERYGQEELFRLANIIQTPSYISFLSALSYFQLATQIVSSEITSCNPVRSKSYTVRDLHFRYLFCKQELYFGFYKEKGFFIAEPAKALLDTLYFVSLGRYALDQNALDLKNMDWKITRKILSRYPKRFQSYFKKWSEAYEGS